MEVWRAQRTLQYNLTSKKEPMISMNILRSWQMRNSQINEIPKNPNKLNVNNKQQPKKLSVSFFSKRAAVLTPGSLTHTFMKLLNPLCMNTVNTFIY